jgi:hypothetical protein
MTTKIKAFLSTVWADIKDTYNRTKIYLWGLAVIVAYIKFNEIKDALLAYAGKKEIESDQKQDSALAKTESSDNAQADALAKKAQEETAEDDWNTK